LAVVDPTSPDGLGARLVARTGIGRGVFLVAERPDGLSRFTWQEMSESRGAQGALERLGSPVSRWALAVAVRKLARLAAADATP
jgi:hypothetical protein